MSILLSLLLGSLPDYHPRADIQCPQHYPGTNYRLPAGTQFNYTPAQLLAHRVRCYCETVKPLERACMRHFSKEECTARSQSWLNANLSLPTAIERVPLNPGRLKNVIINIQPTP